MNINATKLYISCVGNSDWNGTWTKNDVEQEMRELDLQPAGNEWIEWILDHCIGQLDWRQTEFIMDDSTIEATMIVDGLTVKISKK